MNIGTIPSTPAGSTVCVTVTGASGVVTASSDGGAKVVSVTKSTSDPNSWIVCVALGDGVGRVYISSGNESAQMMLRGR
jgi:fructose-specific phosphotransferase system IIC component